MLGLLLPTLTRGPTFRRFRAALGEASIVDRETWEPQWRGAADAIGQGGNYRSKRLLHIEGGGEHFESESLIEEAPSRLRVLQTIHDPTEGDLYDLWIVIDGHRYRNAGLWIDAAHEPDEQQAEDRRSDDALKLEAYGALLRQREPDRVLRYETDSGRAFLICEYSSVPAALQSLLASEESVSGQTRLWLRLDDHSLAKASANVEASTGEESVTMKVEQAFTNYGAPISISAPLSPLVPTD